MKKIDLKISLWITAAIMAFVLLSADVMAQRGQRNFQKPGMGQGMRQGMGQGMMQDRQNWEPGYRWKEMLNLTEEQDEQLKALWVQHMEEMLPLRNKMQEKRAQLQTLRTAKNVDKKAVNNLIDDITALQAKQMKTRESHHQMVRNILTDEQRVIFDSHRSMKRGPRLGKCPGFGMRGPGGPGMGAPQPGMETPDPEEDR